MTTILTPDICVVGGGSAGLTVAAAAAGFGVPVVLVEKARMGGDCLNYGCVPSKALIAAAKQAHCAREAPAFGIDMTASVDFKRVHDHVHEVIATIAPHDSVARFERLGVTVLQQHARFEDERTLVAGDAVIRARRFVVATGSRPAVPPIDGLGATPFLTNESIFDLERLPERLVIVGGGAIGAELAQAYRRLGSGVIVLERDRFLAKEDPELVAIVRSGLAADDVDIREGVDIARVDHDPANGFAIRLGPGDGGELLAATDLLVAAGRTANVEGLDLHRAGVAHTPSGITVDGGLRTANRRIYAIGDCIGGPQFTHVAGHQASLAVRSILFRLPVKFVPERMPRVTFTSPELAQVGLTEPEAVQRHGGASVTTVRGPLSGNDRAVAERASAGIVKLVVAKSGRILGVGIVAPDAGEMIAPYALALNGNKSIRSLASAVFAYPTMAEAGKTAAVEFYKPKLTSGAVRKMLSLLRRLG